MFNAVKIDLGPDGEERTLSILSTTRWMGLARRLGWMRDEVDQEQPAFTYRVLRPSCGLAEKRTQPRMRTRLRTGKIVDDQNGFLTECRFHDRSQSGARLELIRAIELPNGLRMFEDGTGLLFAIRPVWRGGNVLGVILEAASHDVACSSHGREAASHREELDHRFKRRAMPAL